MSNVLKPERQALVLRCLLEGTSVNATARICGTTKVTVLKLLQDAGRAAAEYQDCVLRDLTCRRIEVDEAWSFIYAKEKTVAQARSAPPEAGDVWLWVALDPDTKLVPTWRIGDRSTDTARDFMVDLADRLVGRVQLTSDGHQPYLEAVEYAFGAGVDYAMLRKIYGPDELEIRADRIMGNPKVEGISTSGVERQNLTLRMSLRRYTRRTNAFSKKLLNHAHALALHYLYYNFCRIHQSLRVTPAMRAGITSQLYNLGWIVKLIEESRPAPQRPKTYRKKVA